MAASDCRPVSSRCRSPARPRDGSSTAQRRDASPKVSVPFSVTRPCRAIRGRQPPDDPASAFPPSAGSPGPAASRPCGFPLNVQPRSGLPAQSGNPVGTRGTERRLRRVMHRHMWSWFGRCSATRTHANHGLAGPFIPATLLGFLRPSQCRSCPRRSRCFHPTSPPAVSRIGHLDLRCFLRGAGRPPPAWVCRRPSRPE